MVTLYRGPDDSVADEIQNALEEMVIAHETVTVENLTSLPDDVPCLPALRDDEEVITGKDALRSHLNDLRDLMKDWNKFQSDACYVEDDGTIC